MAKTVTKKSTKRQPREPKLHLLIGALSYWGTFVRGILFAIITLLLVLLFHSLADSEIKFWSLVGAILLMDVMLMIYDALYVGLARALKMNAAWDRLVLFVTEALFVMALLIVGGGVAPDWLVRLVALTPLLAMGVLLLRMILGVMSTRNKGGRNG